MLAGILTLKCLKETAGIRLTGFSVFLFVCFCFLMLVLFEDSCQHCVSNGNNGLIKTKGLSMVCRGCQIQHQKTCAAQNWGCL